MTIQTPTRITIEIHPPQDGTQEPIDGGASPIVRVIPEPLHVDAQTVVVAEPRDAVEPPAAYDPGPCLCLDDEDCGADHGNE
jgi:hypothetical protein